MAKRSSKARLGAGLPVAPLTVGLEPMLSNKSIGKKLRPHDRETMGA